jgi:hypothetical protein
MFCPQCGSPNPDEARFCRICAATLPTQSQAGRPEDQSTSGLEAPTQYLPPEPPRPSPPDPDQGYRSAFESRQSPPNPDPYGAYMSQHQPPGYSPSYPPAPSYPGAQPPTANSPSGRAVVSLVLSIMSVVFTCCFVFFAPVMSIAGMVLGKMEMNAIRAGQAPAAGETMAKVGFWMGLVMTILSAVLIVFQIIFGVFSVLSNLGNMQ